MACLSWPCSYRSGARRGSFVRASAATFIGCAFGRVTAGAFSETSSVLRSRISLFRTSGSILASEFQPSATAITFFVTSGFALTDQPSSEIVFAADAWLAEAEPIETIDTRLRAILVAATEC
jgi:hypothetical protein